MPVTTPLTDFAQQQVTSTQADVDTLKASLTAQDGALPTAWQTVAEAKAALQSDVDQEAAYREALRDIETPADSDPIITALEGLLVTEQDDRARVATAADQLADALRTRASTAAALNVATGRRDAAQASAGSIGTAAAQVEAWLQVAESSAVSDAITAATAARGSQPYQDAQAHIKTIVDSGGATTMYDLFARRAAEAANRSAHLAASADRAVDAREALLATQAPLQGAVAQAQTRYDRQVARLQDLATNALTDWAAATASLTAVAHGAGLTPAEQGAVSMHYHDATTAAPKEVAVYDANDRLRGAQDTLDAAVLAKIAADPTFDASTSADVQAERDDVNAKQGDLQNARNDLAGSQGPLDAYEAALPDAVKDDIVAFFRADALIGKLEGFGTTVPDDVGAAATDLATAWANLAKQEASADRLDREAADRTAAVTSRSQVSDARAAELIRGEGTPA
jgi:hypothetical protein